MDRNWGSNCKILVMSRVCLIKVMVVFMNFLFLVKFLLKNVKVFECVIVLMMMW